jgi:epoxide hydrolase-like predicted phosphatase
MSNDMKIKVILFDLGGVLFTHGTTILAEYIAKKHSKNQKDVYQLLNYSDIGNAYREGKITRDEFWDRFKHNLKIKSDTDDLEQKWIDVYELIEEVRQIIKELGKKYRIYFLSDQARERVMGAEKRYNFIQLFHGGIFSYEVGVRKPNSRIYEIAIEEIGVKPEEILFIDDKTINLPPAEQLGMQTLLCISTEQLREDLLKKGFLED